MRASVALGLPLLLVLGACDSGAGAPCLLDSDCADFSQVCVDSICVEPGASLRDGGEADMDGGEGPTDAGELETDAGPLDDAGPFDAGALDAAPLDAAPLDAAPLDAAPLDAAPLDGSPDASSCVSIVRDWQITSALGTCSSLMGATVTFDSSLALRCGYAVSSSHENGPDGNVSTAPDGTFAGQLQIPGSVGPSECTGTVSATTLTMSCTPSLGTCDMALTAI